VTLVVPTPTVADADPLPLPAAWGVADALAALREARDRLPMMLPDPLVVGALTTVVFRCGAFAVKVYPPGTDPGHLARIPAALAGYRSVVLPVSTPLVTTAGAVVVVSPWLGQDGPAVAWPAIGALLRRFHAEAAEADLPPFTPLRRVVTVAGALPPDAAEVLLAARTTLLAQLERLPSGLGVGGIHGDVSPFNVVRGSRRPMLIDLDFVATGPREYDLACAARRVAAGEISRAEYAGFCSAYGADVRCWPGLPLLDGIADLAGVAFRIWDGVRRGLPLDWVADELPRWRTPC
jgi:Phosphotransferase enzyme family